MESELSLPSFIVASLIILIIPGILTDSAYAIAAGSIKNTLLSALIPRPIVQYISGGLLIGLGLKAALRSQRS